ncbi:MAG TPA: hypothetical protein VGM94_16095 [Galbitalea sp.]|jgi:hypothetical protein
MSLLRLAAPGIAIAVDAARGGRLTSLIGADGREWLAQSSARENTTPLHFTDDLAGWDECAPTIDECVVDGRPLPDHGDLWAVTWSVVEHSGERLVMAARGASLGYELTRTIELRGAGMTIDYSATSEGDALPFLWAAHPQFLATATTRVQLEPGIDRVVDVLGDRDVALEWSADLATAGTLEPGGFRKLYVDPGLRPTSASLVHDDGASLTLAFEGCDYLGLWFDRAAYSTETVIALEPSTAYRDSLAWAIDNGTAARIPSRGALRWRLDLDLA